MSTKINKRSIAKSYADLIKRSKFDLDFALMTVLSASICFFGFKMDSSAVIIGSMVISPILYSVVSFSVTTHKRDWSNLKSSLKTLLLGIAIAIVTVVVIDLIYPTNTHVSEITDRIVARPADYFFVALLSGAAGTFAYFWPGILEAIAGIAISVALIPPIVLIGIAIAILDLDLLMQSGLIVLINIIGVYLGSMIIFIILQKLAKKR